MVPGGYLRRGEGDRRPSPWSWQATPSRTAVQSTRHAPGPAPPAVRRHWFRPMAMINSPGGPGNVSAERPDLGAQFARSYPTPHLVTLPHA